MPSNIAPPTEEQLAQTQKALDKLRKEYEEFAYIVSHDLSGPLRAIEGFSVIVAEKNADKLDEKARSHLSTMSNSAKECKSILEALLRYSRLNTQQEPFSDCDSNEIIDSVKVKLADLIKKSQATISYNKLPVIRGDKKHLSVLFYQLLHNALLYHDKGTSTEISIGCKEINGFWRFSLRDNGIGIKDSMLEKVFKVLRRGVSKKKYPGLGMGLAYSQKIVERHGGEITVESVLDRGTVVHFTIAK